MTSEQDDSHANATWEGPKAINQDQQLDQSPTTDVPEEQESVLPQLETDVEEPQDTQSSSAGKVTHFLRRFSPVFVPLPFAILVFVFTIPFALHGQAFLPLLPLGVLLIALVVMQGTLLYYLGSNDTYWTLVVIIGYALFLVVGTLAIFGLVASLILLFILLGIGILLARRSMRQIPEGSVEIVLMSGKYARTLYPGLNFKMMWETISNPLNTKETIWTCPEQVVKISRDQEVKLVAMISYQLVPEDAHIAALNVKDWEESLQNLFVATLQNVINKLSPADFVDWPQGPYSRASLDKSSIDAATITRWDPINDALERRVQDKVAGWGVQINFVRIRDIIIIPLQTSGIRQISNIAPRPVDVGMTRGENSPAVQQVPAQVAPSTVENQQVVLQAPTVPVQVPIPVTATYIDTLKESYEAVRAGLLKDPDTIRSIAMQFDALARDPNVSFDAARAAKNLYDRADIYQQKNERKGPTSISPNVVAQPDTKERGQASDNIWTGG